MITATIQKRKLSIPKMEYNNENNKKVSSYLDYVKLRKKVLKDIAILPLSKQLIYDLLQSIKNYPDLDRKLNYYRIKNTKANNKTPELINFLAVEIEATYNKNHHYVHEIKKLKSTYDKTTL